MRTELLNIMGLTWLYQTDRVNRLLASQNEVLALAMHRFGRMSQEEGFYVDVGLQLAANFALDGIVDDGRYDNVFHLGSLYASALEHGILEQMQPDTSAVSTVNILRQANQDGQRIYLADSSNWTAGSPTIKSLIEEHYTSSQVDAFTTEIEGKGARLLLPYNDDISQGEWTGSGWVIRSPTRAGMIINGGYSGGYSTNYSLPRSPPISTSSYTNPSYTYTAPSMPSLQPLPSLPTLPTMYASDPVDMASGAFIYAHVDLETGTEPAQRAQLQPPLLQSGRCGTISTSVMAGRTHCTSGPPCARHPKRRWVWGRCNMPPVC